MNIFKDNAGVTIVEVLIVIAIFGVLSAISLGIYGNLLFTSQLDESGRQIVQMLRIAKERSMARYNDSAHGLYLNINPSGSDSVILFQGSSYAARDSEYDRVLPLKGVLNLSTTITDNEVVFSKGVGKPDKAGNIVITHAEGKTRTVIINSFGLVKEQ